MTTQDLYHQLKQIDLFRDKISLLPNGGRFSDITEECIELYFHQYLTILIVVDDYNDESYVEYNRCTHCHIDNEDIIEELTYLANGNLIFIQKKGWFGKGFRIVKVVEKDDFNIKKAKFFQNKHIKVYSALALIYPAD